MIAPDLPQSEFTPDQEHWRRPITGQVWPAGRDSAGLPHATFLSPPFPKTITIHLDRGSLAWANALDLHLFNRSAADCLTGIRLLAQATQGDNPQACYHSGVLEPLAAGSGRRVQFHVDTLVSDGRSWDWSRATTLEIILALPKDSPHRGDLAVVVEEVRCLRLTRPVGPRLTEAGLGRVVSPGNCLANQRNGRMEMTWSPRGQATAAIRTRPPLPWPLESCHCLLAGRIMGRQVGFPPDWDPGDASDQHWRHFLHRHHFLRALVAEHAQTRAANLEAAAATAISDWITRHPVPLRSSGGCAPAWETLSTAWRLWEWLRVLPAMAAQPGFGRPNLNLLLRSAWEHAWHLMAHQGHPTNWALVEAAVLALAGLELDCFRDAPAWAGVGLERLSVQARRQFWSDGTHFELSPLYQAICLEALLTVDLALTARGLALPADVAGSVDLGLQHLRALRRPDGAWPALNDSWGLDQDFAAVLDLVQAAGRQGGAPEEGSDGPERGAGGAGRHFHRAGICLLGGVGASSGGNRLLLRAGPAGAAHAHDDALSLDVSLGGRPFVVDPGVSTYETNHGLTAHYRSLAAHSLPWMAGWSRSASDMTWSRRIASDQVSLTSAAAPGLEAASAAAWGPWAKSELAGVIFRGVVCCLGEYFVVRDHFRGRGMRQVEVGWQFAPGELEVAKDGLAAWLHGPQGVVGSLLGPGPGQGLELIRLEGCQDPLGGWVAKAGQDIPAAHLSHRLTAPLPLTLVWLLWPGRLEPGAAHLLPGDLPGAVHLRLDRPGGGWDELTWGPPRLAARSPTGLRQGAIRLVRHDQDRAPRLRQLPG